MTELLYEITVAQFCGGLVSQDGVVTDAAPFIRKFIKIGSNTRESLKEIRRRFKNARIVLVRGTDFGGF